MSRGQLACLVLTSKFLGTIFSGIASYHLYHLSIAETLVVISAVCSIFVNISCTSLFLTQYTHVYGPTDMGLHSLALLAFRLWKLGRSILPHPKQNSVLPIFWLIVDAAMLYTVTLVITLVCVILNINPLAIMLEVVSRWFLSMFSLSLMVIHHADGPYNIYSFLWGYDSSWDG